MIFRDSIARPCLILAFLVLAPSAHALDRHKALTQYRYTSWTERDGLPSAIIYSMAQTTDGYLWLATAVGLVRFDGIHFLLWRPKDKEQPADPLTTFLCGTRDGSLWIGRASGAVSRMNASHLENYSVADGVTPGPVAAILEDRDGAIWVGTQSGLCRFRDRHWERVGTEEGLPGKAVRDLFLDRRGTLWVATDDGLASLAGGKKKFELISRSWNAVEGLAEDTRGTLWIADYLAGIKLLGNNASREGEGAFSSISRPYRIVSDRDGNLWIATLGTGIRRISPAGEAEVSAAHPFSKKDGLSSNTVWSILEDHEGNIWVGTENGLDCFQDSRVTPLPEREGLAHDTVTGLAATSDGSVWIGTLGGLIRVHGADRSFYTAPDVVSLYVDREGRLLTGGEGVAHPEGHSLSFLPLPKGVLSRVQSITEDLEGGLWLCETYKGLFRWQSGKLVNVGEKESFGQRRPTAVYTDGKGRVWTGFSDGAVASYQDGQFRMYTEKDGLTLRNVNGIYEDRTGAIWVAAVGGLGRFAKGRFATLGRRNGLPGDVLYGMVQDEHGFFWLLGSEGIVRVEPNELNRAVTDAAYQINCKLFDVADGFHGAPNGIGHPSAVRAADGRLWFATGEGVAVVDPKRLEANRVPPPVHIEQVLVDGQHLESLSSSRLAPGSRTIQIDYTALCFLAPEKIRFRYKLEGFDREWSEALMRRQTIYTNLGPGKYQFRVIASNNDGVWNEKGDSWEFSVQPAFYQTTWFRILCFGLLALLLWALYRLRVERVAAQLNLRFEERLAERTRVAQELHDTLLQGFLGVAMQLHVATEQVSPDSPAKPALDRILKRVRQVVEEGRTAVYGLRSPASGEGDLEQMFSRAGEEIFSERPVQARVVIEGKRRQLHPIIRDEVYRIGREALVNVMRHARASKVEVELEYTSESFRLCVRDDGSGMSAEVIQSGREGHWGIPGMRERAARMGARFKVWSRPRAGTEVELVVPAHAAFAKHPDQRLEKGL